MNQTRINPEDFDQSKETKNLGSADFKEFSYEQSPINEDLKQLLKNWSFQDHKKSWESRLPSHLL